MDKNTKIIIGLGVAVLGYYAYTKYKAKKDADAAAAAAAAPAGGGGGGVVTAKPPVDNTNPVQKGVDPYLYVGLPVVNPKVPVDTILVMPAPTNA
jgi:hypothetical protein